MCNAIWASGSVLLAIVGLYIWPASAADDDGRRIAVLIGTDKYDGTGLRNLDFAEKDVAALGETLEKKLGYKVTLLTRSEWKRLDNDFLQPTATNIRNQLKAALADRRPADTVLVAFSGHGAHLKKTGKLYYCPTGTDLEKEDTLVPVDDIFEALKACKAGSKVLIMDACRNDPADGRTGGAPPAVGSVTRPLVPDLPGGTVALFSCSKGQIAYESKKFGHGFLFHFLIEGLNGKAVNRNGEVAWRDLTKYVEDELPDAVREQKGPTSVQVPESKGENRGLVLGRVAVSTAKTPASKVPGPMPMDLGLTLLKLDSTRHAVSPDDAKKIQAEWAKSMGIDLPLKVSIGGGAMEFVLIPPGAFLMGSQRLVRFTKPFLMSVREVSQAEFSAIAKKNPSWFSKKPGVERVSELLAIANTGAFPVERVKWDDAQEFASRIQALCQASLAVPNHQIEVRLPTEAEWEYAGRAGGVGPFQNEQAQLKTSEANFKDRNLRRTDVCGKGAANPFGLHDMHGNVAEWCQDAFEEKLGAFEVIDPAPLKPRPNVATPKYVVLGGSWADGPAECEFGARDGVSKDTDSNKVGFRVVIVLKTDK